MQDLKAIWLMWWIRLCVQYNLDFNTVDIWRAICESMPEAGFCWREGCDNSLAGYNADAFYCSPECGQKAYEQMPESKAKRKAYQQSPKRKALDKVRQQLPKFKAYIRAYRQTPEYKASRKDYWDANKDWINADRRAKWKAERLAAEEHTSP